MNIKIPEGWEVRKIKEVGKVITGKTPPTDNKEYWGGDIPFITPTDIEKFDIRFNYNVKRKVSNNWLKKSKNSLLPKNAICFVSIGSTIGKMCMVKKPSFTNQQINSIIVDDKHNPFFIYYLLRYFQKDIHLKFTGGGAKGIINKTTFENIELPVPPLPEQEKIAEILGSIDDQIENLTEQNKTLEEIAKTVFKRWFIDFEFPNEEGKPYKSSGGEFVDSELGKIPKGWRVGTFGEFVDIVKGLSYKGKFLTEKSDIILINLKNVGLDGSFRYEGIKYYEGDYKAKHIVKSGDIVVAATDLTRNGDILANPILIPNLETNTAIISMDLSKIVIKETKYKWFLFFLMKTKSFKNFAKSYASGTTVLHLKLDELKKYKFPLPQIDILELFYYLSDNIMNKIVVNNNQIQTLTQLRDTLLPKLITGQIRVKV